MSYVERMVPNRKGTLPTRSIAIRIMDIHVSLTLDKGQFQVVGKLT